MLSQERRTSLRTSPKYSIHRKDMRKSYKIYLYKLKYCPIQQNKHRETSTPYQNLKNHIMCFQKDYLKTATILAMEKVGLFNYAFLYLDLYPIA